MIPAFLALCFLGVTPGAQPPSWTRPYVADAHFYLEKTGSQREPIFPGQRLELEAGQAAYLVVAPLDQWGGGFPEDKAAVFLENRESCPGILEASVDYANRVRLRAGLARGSCRLTLTFFGNLNLSWNFEVKVTSLAKGGYTRAQAEFPVTRLYRALLNREPDPQGFQAAVMEVQRNRLGSPLEGMLASPEFKQKCSGLAPSSFLEQVYRGLLERPPDSSGVARYLREVERGKLKKVLADIIHSEEFESAMAAAERR
ncbi:MAG: DUF4214 domain-containing protein [Thermoanaerobaculaceae bacterium]